MLKRNEIKKIKKRLVTETEMRLKMDIQNRNMLIYACVHETCGSDTFGYFDSFLVFSLSEASFSILFLFLCLLLSLSLI